LVYLFRKIYDKKHLERKYRVWNFIYYLWKKIPIEKKQKARSLGNLLV